jgi:putative endonuclease
MKVSYVYILKCSDGTYYTGVTSKLEQRVFQHQTGFYPNCYTFARRPIELVFYGEFTDINLAIEKEKQIKKWSKAKKEALINGEYDLLPNLAKKRF